MRDEEKAWIANEGVRVSRIFQALSRNAARDPRARSALSRLIEAGRGELVSFGNRADVPVSGNDIPDDAAPFEAAQFEGAAGYDPDFLEFSVPLPTLAETIEDDVTPRLDGAGEQLQYHHFSIVMRTSRRLAAYAAVNIDGDNLVKPTKRGSWRTDKRIDRTFQSDNRLYKFNPLDRGHLVRRLNPVWGPEAEKALADTYHYTNAAPQEHGFNDGIWGELEDFILHRARASDHKVTVFCGPVYTDEDGFYGSDREGGPYQLPARYWKLVVFAREDGSRSVSAYLLTQAEAIQPLLERMTEEEARTVQVHLGEVEELTGLDFGELREFDRFEPDGTEATGVHVIAGPEDAIL